MSKKGQKITSMTPAILAEFRATLGEDELNGLLTDFDCERFLFARGFDIVKAREMAVNWHVWINTPLPTPSGATPKDILNEPLDPNEHVYQQYMPHSNVGEDKKGNPIYWEETGLISGRFKAFKTILSEDDLFVRHIRQQELMVKRMESQSARLGRNIDRQVIVFNMKNLTYSMDPAAMNTFIRTVKIDQTMYPQRLETLFIINSPWFFRAIWAVISPWIDPITAAKIKILGSDYLKTLTEYIDIDQVPAEWGGKRAEFPWQFPHNFSDADALLGEQAIASLPVCSSVTPDMSELETDTTDAESPDSMESPVGFEVSMEPEPATDTESPDSVVSPVGFELSSGADRVDAEANEAC